MKLSLELKALIFATASAVAAVSIAFAAGKIVRQKANISTPNETVMNAPATPLLEQGHKLFLNNCAHCHGADARGDEGPDLHDIAKSDARITSMIKNGIKGEMPKFNSKLTDPDIQSLIAYLRTLKD